MGFYSDKKKEHEALAEKALQNKDYAMAFFHTAEAAKYTFSLAEQCSGKLAQAYLTNANDLVDIAAQLKAKVQTGKTASGDPEGGDELQPASGEGGDSAMRLAELPKERLKDVSGMEEAKRFVVNNVITPILNPDKAKKYGLDQGGGLLLYGLPGTGKTFFAKAVAGELGVPFYVLDTSKVMGKYVGESQKAIKELFDTARKNPMSVIFIDETNGVLPSRNDSNIHETTKQVQDIILQEVDGIESDSKNPFLLIGATNYPGNLDDAALSRFPKRVEVGLPDDATRRFILERELPKRMEIPIDGDALDFLVASTDGFSCRDIVLCSKELRGIAAERNAPGITLDFCRENFVDKHVESVDVAASIADFKKRVGVQNPAA